MYLNLNYVKVFILISVYIICTNIILFVIYTTI